jgi:hypothetical protein
MVARAGIPAWCVRGRGAVATTKLFKSGNSLAVRLPAAFAARPGTPVEAREFDERELDWTLWDARFTRTP